MRSWFQYSLNKASPVGMKFLYLRIGSAEKLYEEFSNNSSELGITWDLEESPTFREYHFGANITEYDGIVVNIGVFDNEIHEFRKDFWENFVWITENNPMVTAIVIPDSSKVGSLTKSEIIEGLSLVRLTDRPFEIFESSGDNVEKITNWIIDMSIIAHRKERIEQETNDP